MLAGAAMADYLHSHNVASTSLFSFHRDYADMGALDQYDAADLDDREYAPIDMDARRRAEAALAERDRRERRGGAGVRAALDSDEGEW